MSKPYTDAARKSTERRDDFAWIPRPLLKLGRGRKGWRFDCAVLMHVEYLHHYGRRTVRAAELAARAGVAYSTALRSIRRLARDGWLTDDHRRNFEKALPPNPKNSFLKLEWAKIREHGTEDAVNASQLEAMPPTAQLEDGRMCAPPALLSTLTGQHPDTARASVRRLALGDTLKVRQRERAGDKATRTPILRLELGWGGAPAYVLRSPTERAKLRKRIEAARATAQQARAAKDRAELDKAFREAGIEPPPAPQASRTVASSRSQATMPPPEALAQMIVQGMAQPPPVQQILRVLKQPD